MSTLQPEEVKGPIQSVSRAAAILRCFYNSSDLSLQEISEMVGLHKSTAFTLITTLKNEHFLEQDPTTSRYRLGMDSFLLGSSTQISLRTITSPYLSTLNRDFGETVNMAVPYGAYTVYITKIESEHSIRICTRIGQRLPFYCTANGKAIFSQYDHDRVDSLLREVVMEKYTANTITDAPSLFRELEIVRKSGYAVDNEELEQGLCCYAVPIFDCAGTPVAAISLSGPVFRMTGQIRDKMIPALQSSAADISAILTKSRYMSTSQSLVD